MAPSLPAKADSTRSPWRANPVSTLTRVGVETVRGTVYLTGVVENWAARERAGDLASQVNGVRGVVNSLQIQTG